MWSFPNIPRFSGQTLNVFGIICIRSLHEFHSFGSKHHVCYLAVISLEFHLAMTGMQHGCCTRAITTVIALLAVAMVSLGQKPFEEFSDHWKRCWPIIRRSRSSACTQFQVFKQNKY